MAGGPGYKKFGGKTPVPAPPPSINFLISQFHNPKTSLQDIYMIHIYYLVKKTTGQCKPNLFKMPRIIHYIFESKIQCVQPLVLPARGTGNIVSDI